MTFANNICYAADHGMVADYLIGGIGGNPYRGIANPDFTDNTPTWNAIMAAASWGTTIVMPPGYCGFASKPNPIPDNVLVTGSGSISGLVKSYAAATQDEFFITTGVEYCTVKNLFLMQASGYQTGTAIGRVATSASDAPYRTIIENVSVTYFGSGTWFGAINIDGAAGAPNYGTRMHIIQNCTLRASCYGLLLVAANGCQAPSLAVVMKDASGVGLWLCGVPNNPLTNFNASGDIQCSVQCSAVRSSAVYSSTLSSIYIDADSVGNSFYAGFLGSTPVVLGHNNHVTGNGQRWDSPA